MPWLIESLNEPLTLLDKIIRSKEGRHNEEEYTFKFIIFQ